MGLTLQSLAGMSDQLSSLHKDSTEAKLHCNLQRGRAVLQFKGRPLHTLHCILERGREG
jgi:hypothetical protein